MQTVRTPKLIDYLFLFSLSAIWGSSFLAIEIALREYSPFIVAFGRISLAAIALCTLVLLQGLSFPREKKTWFLLLCTGALNSAIPFYLISWGQQYVDGSTVALILSGGPFMALLLSRFITHDETFTIYKLLGVGLGFLGIFILLGSEIAGKNTDAIYGQLAVFLAVNCYVMAGFLIRKLGKLNSNVLGASMLAMATLVMAPFLVTHSVSGVSWSVPTFSILFLALIPTAFATLLRVRLVLRTGVQFMSQVAYLIPIFAIFWSWVFLSRIPSIETWVALILIFSGLFVRGIK